MNRSGEMDLGLEAGDEGQKGRGKIGFRPRRALETILIWWVLSR